jgi:hypothetical protein
VDNGWAHTTCWHEKFAPPEPVEEEVLSQAMDEPIESTEPVELSEITSEPEESEEIIEPEEKQELSTQDIDKLKKATARDLSNMSIGLFIQYHNDTDTQHIRHQGKRLIQKVLSVMNLLPDDPNNYDELFTKCYEMEMISKDTLSRFIGQQVEFGSNDEIINLRPQ